MARSARPACIERERMASIRVLLAWSSGKDSAWTLHVLRQEPDVEVVGLLTTFTISRDGFCFTDLVHPEDKRKRQS